MEERARARPEKVDRKKVTADEHRLAAAVLDAFNAAAGTKFSAVEFRAAIIRRHREHAELTTDDHAQVIERNFRVPWWKGRPSPGVIYGSAAQFERSLNCDGKHKALTGREARNAERRALWLNDQEEAA